MKSLLIAIVLLCGCGETTPCERLSTYCDPCLDNHCGDGGLSSCDAFCLSLSESNQQDNCQDGLDRNLCNKETTE